MVKNTLVFGIIVLFIVSAVSPMVIGLKSDTVDVERDELLDDLAFYCLDASGGNAKHEYYEEQMLKDYSNDNLDIIVGNVVQSVEPLPSISSNGPMNSSWPMKCHDNCHTSRSPYSTADNPSDEIWRYKTSDWVEGGPIIDDDGTIYFGDFDGYLYALNPDGTKKWTYKTDGWISSAPALAEDGTLYVGSWDCKLYAFNPDGTLKWNVGASGGSIASSPAIADDGTIYFGTMRGFDKGDIIAVNPNGTVKWVYPTGYYITSDPAIGDDGTVYIGSGDTYFYAMNPNGTLKWQFKTGHYIKGPASIADDDTIYIGSWDDYLYALYPNNGTMKWKCKVGYGTETNPSIANDGTIYVGGDKLWAIYPNGTMRWVFNLGQDRHIHTSSPAISADGTIYVGVNIGSDAGGEILAINPDGTERWRKRIAGWAVESSPCIGEDGTIYVGSTYDMSEGYLYAFGRGELEADAGGPHYGLINLPVQFYGSATGGYPPYSWFWDFGDGNVSDEQNLTHIYTYPGNFTVMLTVTDDSGNTSDDSTWAWIQESNDPPNKPIIDGETNGEVGQSYDYTFETTDPEGLQIWYYIEWGDDTNTGWIGHYPSGEEITKSHSWSEKDTYTIRCKAKDPYEAESEWGELDVTMPMNQQSQYWWFLQFLQNHPRMFPIIRQILGL
ncbi:MAG: PQQ-binding-like beta-propeller repeat protein [Thermoplasmatales archaeon]|nr:PQQ-binding-like beta-propeller repeat protein [Thermoplasmatales archaeon]